MHLISVFIFTLGLFLHSAVRAEETSHDKVHAHHSGHDMAGMIREREEKDDRALSKLVDITMRPEFKLQTAQGEVVTEADFSGQYLLIGFGFTHCGHVCPTLLSNWAQALKQLPRGQRDKVQPIFISLDPDRDTPSVTDRYSKLFSAEFMGLSGSASEIDAVARNFRITYVRVPTGGDDYKIDHTSISYLLSPGRDVVALIGFGTAPTDIASEMAAVIP